jgi:UPF0755 protein
MTRRSRLILAAFILLLALTAGAGLRFAWFLRQPVEPPAPRLVAVPPGASFAGVAARLEAEGVIASAFQFRILSRLRGDARQIKAGEYGFMAPAGPGTVLDRLIAGDVRRLKFTVPEGLNLAEIAAKLDREGRGDKTVFLALARDPAFIATLGLDVPSLEGYLFPETYTLESGTSEKRLIRAMVEQFRTRLAPKLEAAAAERGLDPHQLVTLASIIQKEAGNEEEMPLVSAVFHNRLRLRMPLQADPTVIYGIADFDGNLTRKHLNTPSPYNTYRMRGLPSGPIASPGEKALRAAAAPAAVDYLYFVSRGDGTHVFTGTLKEHNSMVRRYQLRRQGPGKE